MKLTNKLNLPAAIVEAIANSGYSRGESDITATGLIEPVRIAALKHKYGDQLEEDASNLIYSLQGQSIHTILERAAGALKSQGFVAEERFYIDVLGWKVGAQIDVFDARAGILQDYKVTSVYAVKDGVKEEYAQQMNIQAECLRQAGYTVNKLQIVAILRDWSKGERDRDVKDADAKGYASKYPEHQIKIIDVPLIPQKEVLQFIKQRVEAHMAARGADEKDLPECTDDERWARASKWAVMEKGKKRATKLHDSKEQADEHAATLGAKVEKRPGMNMRCASYCPVARKCSQWKRIKAGGDN
jgi:hypothetical protein